MTMAPGNQVTHPDGEADRQADAMKDRLRKDVASWSAARSGTHARDAAESSVPVPPPPPAPRPAKRAKRPKPVSPDAGAPANAARKPFRMSYDGVTEADYISYIIERGA